MKYICLSYSPKNNSAQVYIFSDTNIDKKFTMYDQTFVTYRGRNYPVMFSSEYDNKIRDFATVCRLGYRGLKVNLEE